ncbi:MAG: M56 family metallopeptidase [Anaerovoracaceae bacterium]|jgi:beta-lactamase regulating signal transducer with metallopeptidase domain
MINTIISSSVLIMIILAIRVVFKGKINPIVQYGLWSLVALRLAAFNFFGLHPVKSTFSVMNVVSRAEATLRGASNVEGVLAGHGEAEAIDNAVLIMDNVQTGIITSGEGITPAAAIDWQLIMMNIWIVGVIVLGLWLIHVNRKFGRKLLKNRMFLMSVRADGNGNLAHDGKALIYKDANINKAKLLPVYVVENLDSPCLMGTKGAAIYVPPGVAADQERLRFAIAHELCHYKHHDLIWAIVRGALLVFFWFNPLVWVAAIMSKRDCELACDYSVLKEIGKEDRLAYGRTLVDLISRSNHKSDVLQMATTMYGSADGIKERITFIARNKKMKATTLIAVLLIALFSVGCTFTAAPDDADDFDNGTNTGVNSEYEEEPGYSEYLERISAFMKEESEKTFSPYYELLDFEISNYKEEVVNGNVEGTFNYKIIHKNYDRDPDTVAYIKEAKEKGNPNYQQMYDEYLQPQEMNFHLKVVIDENDSMTLYSNISPVGVEWEETKMSDYILR